MFSRAHSAILLSDDDTIATYAGGTRHARAICGVPMGSGCYYAEFKVLRAEGRGIFIGLVPIDGKLQGRLGWDESSFGLDGKDGDLAVPKAFLDKLAQAAGNTKWVYLDDSGVQQGPYQASKINEWYQSGLLKADHKVKKEGAKGDFVELSTVPELCKTQARAYGSRYHQCWDGQQALISNGCKVGLVFDSGHGSLAVFLDGKQLGFAVQSGLPTDLAWAVSFENDAGDSVILSTGRPIQPGPLTGTWQVTADDGSYLYTMHLSEAADRTVSGHGTFDDGTPYTIQGQRAESELILKQMFSTSTNVCKYVVSCIPPGSDPVCSRLVGEWYMEGETEPAGKSVLSFICEECVSPANTSNGAEDMLRYYQQNVEPQLHKIYCSGADAYSTLQQCMVKYYQRTIEPQLRNIYRFTLESFRVRQMQQQRRAEHAAASNLRAAKIRTENFELQRSAEFSMALQFYCVPAVQDAVEPLLWLDYARRTAKANEHMHEGETLAQYMWSRGLFKWYSCIRKELGDTIKTPDDLREVSSAELLRAGRVADFDVDQNIVDEVLEMLQRDVDSDVREAVLDVHDSMSTMQIFYRKGNNAGQIDVSLHRHYYGFTLGTFRANRAKHRDPGQLKRNSTLNVTDYAGEELTVMYHGTDSRAAQLICCKQLFRPSKGGLLGDGIYMTQTRQKAEGYRIHHPNAGAVGSNAYNGLLTSGEADPGCILQFRVRLGACKHFSRDPKIHPVSEFKTWHDRSILTTTSSIRKAAVSAGVRSNEIRYNSAFSGPGCPCCPIHGINCPGSPNKGHRPLPGVEPCEGRCRAAAIRTCPKANVSFEEFCVFNPARIDHIEVIDGSEELIGFGRDFWHVSQQHRDAAFEEKQASLDAAAETLQALMQTKMAEQISKRGTIIELSGFTKETYDGTYERGSDRNGWPVFEHSVHGTVLFYYVQSNEWRVGSASTLGTSSCLGSVQADPFGRLPTGLRKWSCGTTWPRTTIEVQATITSKKKQQKMILEQERDRELAMRQYYCHGDTAPCEPMLWLYFTAFPDYRQQQRDLTYSLELCGLEKATWFDYFTKRLSIRTSGQLRKLSRHDLKDSLESKGDSSLQEQAISYVLTSIAAVQKSRAIMGLHLQRYRTNGTDVLDWLHARGLQQLFPLLTEDLGIRMCSQLKCFIKNVRRMAIVCNLQLGQSTINQLTQVVQSSSDSVADTTDMSPCDEPAVETKSEPSSIVRHHTTVNVNIDQYGQQFAKLRRISAAAGSVLTGHAMQTGVHVASFTLFEKDGWPSSVIGVTSTDFDPNKVVSSPEVGPEARGWGLQLSAGYLRHGDEVVSAGHLFDTPQYGDTVHLLLDLNVGSLHVSGGKYDGVLVQTGLKGPLVWYCHMTSTKSSVRVVAKEVLTESSPGMVFKWLQWHAAHSLFSFLADCGQQTWYERIVKHSSIRTVSQLREISAFDLRKIAKRSQVAIDQRHLDTLLKLIQAFPEAQSQSGSSGNQLIVIDDNSIVKIKTRNKLLTKFYVQLKQKGLDRTVAEQRARSMELRLYKSSSSSESYKQNSLAFFISLECATMEQLNEAEAKDKRLRLPDCNQPEPEPELQCDPEAGAEQSRRSVQEIVAVSVRGHAYGSYNGVYSRTGMHAGLPRFERKDEDSEDGSHHMYYHSAKAAWVLRRSFAPTVTTCKSWITWSTGTLPDGSHTWQNGGSSDDATTDWRDMVLTLTLMVTVDEIVAESQRLDEEVQRRMAEQQHNAVVQAQELGLGGGLVLSGLPDKSYNGTYRRVKSKADGGWPWYQHETTAKHLYRHRTFETWLLNDEYTPTKPDSHGYISSESGVVPEGVHEWRAFLPAGPQSWKCFKVAVVRQRWWDSALPFSLCHYYSSTSSFGGSSTELKAFMTVCGLEAWHSYFIKYTSVRTPEQLCKITSMDLKIMATSSNMRLDDKTIDLVLTALRRGKLRDRQRAGKTTSPGKEPNIVSFYAKTGMHCNPSSRWRRCSSGLRAYYSTPFSSNSRYCRYGSDRYSLIEPSEGIRYTSSSDRRFEEKYLTAVKQDAGIMAGRLVPDQSPWVCYTHGSQKYFQNVQTQICTLIEPDLLALEVAVDDASEFQDDYVISRHRDEGIATGRLNADSRWREYTNGGRVYYWNIDSKESSLQVPVEGVTEQREERQEEFESEYSKLQGWATGYLNERSQWIKYSYAGRAYYWHLATDEDTLYEPVEGARYERPRTTASDVEVFEKYYASLVQKECADGSLLSCYRALATEPILHRAWYGRTLQKLRADKLWQRTIDRWNKHVRTLEQLELAQRELYRTRVQSSLQRDQAVQQRLSTERCEEFCMARVFYSSYSSVARTEPLLWLDYSRRTAATEQRCHLASITNEESLKLCFAQIRKRSGSDAGPDRGRNRHSDCSDCDHDTNDADGIADMTDPKWLVKYSSTASRAQMSAYIEFRKTGKKTVPRRRSDAEEEELKEFCRVCGLDAWFRYFKDFTEVKNPRQLYNITEAAIIRLGDRANMRLTPQVVKKVLTAAKSKSPLVDVDQLKSFMSRCGLQAWYDHIVDHTDITTPHELEKITATDLDKMAAKVQMKIDAAKIVEVLNAVKHASTRKKWLERYMDSCGLKAWYTVIVTHTSIITPQQLQSMTAFDLERLALKANMRLDQATIDKVLAAISRNRPPISTSYSFLSVSLPSSVGSVQAQATLAGAGDQLKEYMKKRGLEAWHSHLTKHLKISTCAQLRAITAVDLRRMATAANMRLDQKTIDQVLAAIRQSQK